ncbi:MAG: AAA family ATPase [Synechococcaceae bacterium WB8_3_299]|nr:AAA family ATPase [Synechococcaceae bacterium WB8_3_299]
MSAAWIAQLDLLIRSRTPILWIRQQEEERLVRLLQQVAQGLEQRPLLRWDFVAGLHGLPNHAGAAARQPLAALDSLDLLPSGNPGLLLLLDFHRFVDDSAICRRLRNLAVELCQQPRTLVIEYCPADADPSEIGGLDQLKLWLERRRLAFTAEAQSYGLPNPRGVLLVGPQGTGKSLTAKAIAHSWGMPLLRLDLGRLFAGLVGASEARSRDMIRTAEAMAPCILWIDEIDKGFSLDGRSDGGTSQRVLATLLTWMAEKSSPVFVVATANAIDKLPPELLRKGRFDELFVLNLPEAEERRQILNLHLRRRRPQHLIPLDTLVDRCVGFSGAELEQVVLEAMLVAFSEGREFGEADLIAAAADLVPLSRTAREPLERLQQWAREGRARPAC